MLDRFEIGNVAQKRCCFLEWCIFVILNLPPIPIMNWKFVLLFAMCLLAGLVFTYDSIKIDKQREAAESNGEVITGEITGGELRKEWNSTSYFLDFTWKDDSGAARTKTFSVDRALFEKHTKVGIVTEPNASIHYLASNGSENMFLQGASAGAIPVQLTAGIALVGLIGLIYAFIGRSAESA